MNCLFMETIRRLSVAHLWFTSRVMVFNPPHLADCALRGAARPTSVQPRLRQTRPTDGGRQTDIVAVTLTIGSAAVRHISSFVFVGYTRNRPHHQYVLFLHTAH